MAEKYPKGIFSQKCAAYKNCDLPKYVDEDVKEAIGKLPSHFINLWNIKNYQKFLEKALFMSKDQYDDDRREWRTTKAEKLATNLLVILPVIGCSRSSNMHGMVQRLYGIYIHIYVGITYVASVYRYVCNAFSAGLKSLIPEDFINNCFKMAFPIGTKELKMLMLKSMSHAQESENKYREMLKNVCQKSFTAEDVFANALAVHEIKPGKLLEVVLDCLNRPNFYKLEGKFEKHPGVYLIYYVRERELYSGSKIHGSDKCPVYVGKSETKVSIRLSKHKGIIEKAKGERNSAAKLELSDFAVKVIFPDNKHYAPCIESMLIEHFIPVWNQQSIGLSFGNADNVNNESNLWNKFYIQQDKGTIDHVLAELKVGDSSSESSGHDNIPESSGHDNIPESNGDDNSPESNGDNNRPESNGEDNSPESKYDHITEYYPRYLEWIDDNSSESSDDD